MPQGVLPFQYVVDQTPAGRTGFAGLGLYLDLWAAMGLMETCEAALPGDCGQGWPAAHTVRALTLLNLGGGESVSDLDVLRSDEGLCNLVEYVDRRGRNRHERRAFRRRFRRGEPGALPSDSAVHRFLASAHDVEEEAQRVPGKAFIPAPNEVLRALMKVNDHLVSFVQQHRPRKVATLDEDATLAQTSKREALFSYKKFKAYQPLNVYWAEQDLVVQSEFRDGNVPAGFKKLDLLKGALAKLPQGVEHVLYRGDSAAYEVELLRYLARGKDPRFGRIEFAVSCDVTDAFKAEVAKLPETDWKPLVRHVEGDEQPTSQQWAEVPYVPNWAGYSKNDPLFRFIAIREPLEQLRLPMNENDSDTKQLPFPTMAFGNSGQQTHKLFGIVTNRDLPGDEIVWWHRQRCGASEHVHSEMKRGLAGGRLPSGKFGASAAWWAIMILALNLNAAMRHLVLKGQWAGRRIKAVRFHLIRMPGRVARHARQLRVKIAAGPIADLFIAARNAIAELTVRTTAPPRLA
jgi:hypothetical protein